MKQLGPIEYAIEYTAEGWAYHLNTEPFSDRHKALLAKLHDIREVTGYKFFDVKMALCNAGGNVELARRDLDVAYFR